MLLLKSDIFYECVPWPFLWFFAEPFVPSNIHPSNAICLTFLLRKEDLSEFAQPEQCACQKNIFCSFKNLKQDIALFSLYNMLNWGMVIRLSSVQSNTKLYDYFGAFIKLCCFFVTSLTNCGLSLTVGDCLITDFTGYVAGVGLWLWRSNFIRRVDKRWFNDYTPSCIAGSGSGENL